MKKHIQRINKNGKKFKYHRITRRSLPSDIPEDHPDFISAYAKASQAEPIDVDRQKHRFVEEDAEGLFVRHRSGIRIPCPRSSLSSASAFERFYNKALETEFEPHEVAMARFAKLGLRRAKERAKKKGVAFAIDEEYVWQMLRSQSFRCAISGLPFRHALPSRGRINPFQPSLDRTEPSRGYVPGNVSWVLHAVNCGKGEMRLKEYFEICEAVTAAQEQNGTQ